MFNEICINEEMLPKYTYIYREIDMNKDRYIQTVNEQTKIYIRLRDRYKKIRLIK